MTPKNDLFSKFQKWPKMAKMAIFYRNFFFAFFSKIDFWTSISALTARKTENRLFDPPKSTEIPRGGKRVPGQKWKKRIFDPLFDPFFWKSPRIWLKPWKVPFQKMTHFAKIDCFFAIFETIFAHPFSQKVHFLIIYESSWNGKWYCSGEGRFRVSKKVDFGTRAPEEEIAENTCFFLVWNSGKTGFLGPNLP